MSAIDKALTQRRSVVQEISEQASPPLVLMTRPPENPMAREAIANQIWTGLLLGFEATLSERDKRLWRSPPADPGQSPEHLRVMHMFDDFLLRQIGEQGPALIMCVGTLQRIFEWKKHNPELLKRLGIELEYHSRVFLGEVKARLPGDFGVFAAKNMPELDRLLRIQRDHFGASTTPTSREVAAWMKTEIQSRPAEFPSLHGNLAQLCGWVETLEVRNPVAGRRVRRGSMGASPFFCLWYANCTKRSLKAVKNEISARRIRR